MEELSIIISNYIFTMGLAMPLAILVAFRAGRLRGLTSENMEERLGDLAFDSVKERICARLFALFNLSMGDGFELPGQLTIQQVAAHLHNDVEDLAALQTLYYDLINLGLQSAQFMEALHYIQGFG